MKAFSGLEQSMHFLNRAHSTVPTHPITGPAAWRSEDISCFRDQIYQLTVDEIATIETLLDRVSAHGAPLSDIGPHDWDDPGLETIVHWCRERLFKGRGFAALSGVPIERWPLVRSSLFLAVLGSQFGRLGLRNPRGGVIGRVQNLPIRSGQPHARNYITDREFRPHCDAADLLGLLAIRPAAHHKGQLKTIYISDYFRGAERHSGYAIDDDAKALYVADERLATDPAFELRFDLQAGDVLLLNNHVMLHARDSFEDSPSAERLLLRFLVAVDHGPGSPDREVNI
jgi:hypothetical protein